MADKQTTSVKVWLSDALELDLHRLADVDQRSLSDYIRLILSRHVYGYRATDATGTEGANRGEEGRT
jgi:predicted transcriptional regulator